jgi:hypothetical protein
VTFFDCLHDMGDPAGASAHVRQSLKPDCTWMIVEPFAYDDLEKNLNPIGRVFYSASTLICTPASRSQEVGLALGAQAGEARIREVVTKGGFTRFLLRHRSTWCSKRGPSLKAGPTLGWRLSQKRIEPHPRSNLECGDLSPLLI